MSEVDQIKYLLKHIIGLNSTTRGNQTVLFTYPSHIFIKQSIFRTCPVSNIVYVVDEHWLVIFCEFRLRHGKNLNV